MTTRLSMTLARVLGLTVLLALSLAFVRQGATAVSDQTDELVEDQRHEAAVTRYGTEGDRRAFAVAATREERSLVFQLTVMRRLLTVGIDSPSIRRSDDGIGRNASIAAFNVSAGPVDEPENQEALAGAARRLAAMDALVGRYRAGSHTRGGESATRALARQVLLACLAAVEQSAWSSTWVLYRVEEGGGVVGRQLVAAALGQSSHEARLWNQRTNPRWRGDAIRRAYRASYQNAMRVVDGTLPLEPLATSVGMIHTGRGSADAKFNRLWNTTGAQARYRDLRASAAIVAEAFGPEGLRMFDAADSRTKREMLVDATLAKFAAVSSAMFSLED